MDAYDVIDVVVGLGIAGTVGGFLYYIVSKINAGNASAAGFFQPLIDNWGTVVIVIALGTAMGFIIPKLMEMRRK